MNMATAKSKILETYTGSYTVGKDKTCIVFPYIDSIQSKQYLEYSQLHSGVDVQTSEVYSRCTGVLLHIGKEQRGTYTLTVQYNSTMCLRYRGITEHRSTVNDIVVAGQLLGYCKQYVHLECLTTIQAESIWPVRIYDTTWWKHDPTPAIDGTLGFDNMLYRDAELPVDPQLQTVFEEE